MRRLVLAPLAPLAPLATALAVLAVLASACGNQEPVALDNVPFPAEARCDPGIAASLQAWTDRGVGSSIVDVGGSRECVAAFGLADLETGRTNEIDTVFAIGSITKPITAAAIFNLIDDGLLSLDDTAGQHVADLSGLPATSTILNLLLHTSGISGEHGFDHRPMSENEAIEAISNLEKSSEPGTKYRYENTNYTILALVIEELTDQGYRQYVVDEILHDRNGDPLNAGWWDGSPSPEGQRAWGYYGDLPARQRGDAPGPHWAMEGNGLIAMSPLQMAEWTYAFFTERVLSPEATQNLLSTSTRLVGDYLELPGWSRTEDKQFGVPFFHTAGGGSGIGHEMNILWFPETSRVVVLARNAVDSDVSNFDLDILPALIVGTGIPTPRSVPAADNAVLEAMVGTYQVGENGWLIIEENDGGLDVAVTGYDAISAMNPVPENKASQVVEQEETSQQLLDGPLTGPSLRVMNRLVEDYGPLQNAVIEGTFYTGQLEVIANLSFRGRTVDAYMGTDILGSTYFDPVIEGAEANARLDYFYVKEGGVFVDHFADDQVVGSTLRLVDGNMEIANVGPPALAIRAS